MIFQSISWHSEDENINDGQDIKFHIYIFGRIYDPGNIPNNKSITVKINDYCPFFYILIPESFTYYDNIISCLNNYIRYKIKTKYESEHGPCKNLRPSGLLTYELNDLIKFYPYTAGEKNTFMKLIFNNMEDFYTAKFKIFNGIQYNGKLYKFEIYESRLDPILKFCHDINIKTTSFLKLKNTTQGDFNCTTDFSCRCSYKDIEQVNDKNIISNTNLKILSYDIETQSSIPNRFPNPEIDGDYIGTIGITVTYLNEPDTYEYYVLTLGPCSDILDESGSDYITIISVNKEKTLLKEYANLVKSIDPDIIIGYNIWGFDDNYIYKRFEKYGLDISLLSRLQYPTETKFKEIKLKSSAYGDNKFMMISYVGRDSLDILFSIKKDNTIVKRYNLTGFSLNNVAKTILKSEKDDLTPNQIFEYLKSKDPDKIMLVSKYCVQDTNLVSNLTNFLTIIFNSIEMANETYVPTNWLLYRGQQCKVFSLIHKYTLSKGFVVPDKIINSTGSYKGATVLDPIRGAYYTPVTGLDFAALYPSIMIAHNLCYSTIVLNEKYNNLESVHYEKFTINNKDTENENNIMNFFKGTKESKDSKNSDNESSEEDYEIEEYNDVVECDSDDICDNNTDNNSDNIVLTFVQDPDNSYEFIDNCPFKLGAQITSLDRKKCYKGILPSILTDLMVSRKDVKKQMINYHKTTDTYKILDAKQLAKKVTMNSVYGFCGTGDKGMLPCKYIAMTVTSRGREMIIHTKELAETKFLGTALYGDSLPGSEYIAINNDLVRFSNVSDYLNREWSQGYRDSKEIIQVENNNLLTISDSGPSKILKFIRHKTNKKLYKIKALDESTGIVRSVIVTEGHSLITNDGKLIESKDIKIGTLLKKI